MSFKKSHFVFNFKQQNGIFLLVIIILVLSVIMYAVRNNYLNQFENSINNSEISEIEKYIDSVKAQKNQPKKDTIYPFNPNYINDYKGYVLGMSVEEIDRLKQFRAQNKWINSKKDFQKVTQVSDSLLNKIAPSFKFPDWVIQQNKTSLSKNSSSLNQNSVKRDLNNVSKEELEKIYGVGEKLSQRIINYRLKIGGFVNDIQLKDIYGLNYETRVKILEKYTVLHAKPITKFSINKASVIELSEIIYFDYELAREIVEYRKLHEKITSFEELAKIESFPAYKIDRIKLYLTIN
ncbi:ComEA family DNA-binding protein [Mesonia phycicola]|uniref:ComEA family DNA-binding protein n=1 Tax=Mesonia phycicola TaxID=579105 RepID=UPI000933E261|nr:helix-hairpin-helix domain-containing protein [Mesonia phycicola]